jgi:peptide/nickel transport system substrate-binding protein
MALTRRAFGGLTIGGSSALMLAACGGDDDDGGEETGGELVWAVSAPWESWNENTGTGNNSSGHIAMTPMIPLGQVGYDFDPEGKVFYDDAIFEGEPQLISEAPMQVQVTLKEGAQWSDGKPVRLEDFIFQWYSTSGNAEHANQEKALPAATSGEVIANIEEPEPGAIVFTFTEGLTDPEWLFTGGVYLPSHYAEENGFADWQTDPEVMGDAIVFFNENLWTVVTGPYKPVDSKLGEYISYEPNEKYQGSVKPKFSKLTLKPVSGIEAEVTELRQGTIAGCWPNDFSLEILQQLDENPEEWKYETYAGATWSHFDMNVGNKFLKDLALRQAVFTAIDIEEIKERAFPGTEVPWLGNHFFNESSPYYQDYTGPANYGKGDLDAATAILTEAGYTWNGDGKLEKDGEQVVFNFRYASSNEIRKLTGEIIQAQLVEAGIDLELKGFADDELSSTLSSGDFDLVVYSWVGDPSFTTAPEQYFGPASDSNAGGYDDPVINELLPQVRGTLDLDEAAEAANQVSQQAVAQAYTLPLYSSPLSIMWNAKMVEGPGANPASQAAALWNLREWKKP